MTMQQLGLIFALIIAGFIFLMLMVSLISRLWTGPEKIPGPVPVELSQSAELPSTLTTAEPVKAEQKLLPPVQVELNRCCVCGEQEDPEMIELDDWRQVRTFRGTLLAILGLRTPMEPGRRLYARRHWCRSCAAIASELNTLWQQQLEVEVQARKRQWERKGLVDATKQAVENEQRRYDEEQNRLRRLRQLT